MENENRPLEAIKFNLTSSITTMSYDALTEVDGYRRAEMMTILNKYKVELVNLNREIESENKLNANKKRNSK